MNKSLTFEQFLATTSSEISLYGFVINLIITAVLAHILSIVYVKFGKSLSNRHAFSRNFILLAMTIMVVITVVKSSLALSLGLVGALSIVRYRTAIKEPEELAYTFLTIAIGLGMGADQTAVTAISFLLIVAIIIIRQKLITEKGEFVNLRISGKKNLDYDLKFLVKLVEKNSNGLSLKRLDEDEETFAILFSAVFTSYEDMIHLRNEISKIDNKITLTYMDNVGGI